MNLVQLKFHRIPFDWMIPFDSMRFVNWLWLILIPDLNYYKNVQSFVKLQIVEVVELYQYEINNRMKLNRMCFLSFFFFMKAFHILRFWYFKMNQYLLICIQYIDIDNLLTSYPAKWNKYFIIIFHRKFWILNRRKEQRRRLNRIEIFLFLLIIWITNYDLLKIVLINIFIN